MPRAMYVRVRLLTDRYHREGVARGAIGYIIHIHTTTAYEVEFSGPDGHTIALIVAHPDELEVAERP